MSSSQYQESLQIQKFLLSFNIIQSKQQSIIISSTSSNNNTYLIRTLSIQQQQQQSFNILQIIQTLTQHQQFSCKHIYNLISFQLIHPNVISHHKNIKIRAIYQYGIKTLKQQIIKRKYQNNLYFQEHQIWGLMYSILIALEYLEKKNIIYGVLGCEKVFLDKNIAIIDPSSTAIDPYEIEKIQQEEIGNNRYNDNINNNNSNNINDNNNNNNINDINDMNNNNNRRIYSPQLLNPSRQISSINMFKSDTFTTGLILLQSCLLNLNITLPYQCYTLHTFTQFIQFYLIQLQQLQIYSQQLINLLKNMLSYSPQQRLSFSEILKKISGMFQVSIENIYDEGIIHVMKCDKEDINNINQWNNIKGMNYQEEIIDVLSEENDMNGNRCCDKGQYLYNNNKRKKYNQIKWKNINNIKQHKYQYQNQPQYQYQYYQQQQPIILTQYQQARQKFFNIQSLPHSINQQHFNTSIQFSQIHQQSFRSSILYSQHQNINQNNYSHNYSHYQHQKQHYNKNNNNKNNKNIINKSQQKCQNKRKISKSKEIKEKLVKNNYGGQQKYQQQKQYKEINKNNNKNNDYKIHNRSNTVGQSINNHININNDNKYDGAISQKYYNINNILNDNYNYNNSINKYNHTSKPIKTATQHLSHNLQLNQNNNNNNNKITFNYNYYQSNKQNQSNPQNNILNNLKNNSHKNINILLNKQNLFTDPKILSMIKNDMKRIQQKKLACKNKINPNNIQ